MSKEIFYARKNGEYNCSLKVLDLSDVKDGDKYWIEYKHLPMTLNFTILKSGYFVTVSTTDDVSIYSGEFSDMENLNGILERCWLDTVYEPDKLNCEADDSLKEKVEVEMVNHPAHYNNGKIECINAMIDAFGNKEVMSFCKINAFKYIWRAEHKGGVKDIKKAAWYLNKYIELAGVTEKSDESRITNGDKAD